MNFRRTCVKNHGNQPGIQFIRADANGHEHSRKFRMKLYLKNIISRKKIDTVKKRAIGRVKCAIGHEKCEFHTMIFSIAKDTTKTRKTRNHENHELVNCIINVFH